MRNSIRIRKCTDEITRLPGLAETDTVAHHGASARGGSPAHPDDGRLRDQLDRERDAQITPRATSGPRSRRQSPVPVPGHLLRLRQRHRFINDELIRWLQQRDIEQTRSRPYRKNDQATVESRNNHVVRNTRPYWRYDAGARDLLNRLWTLTYALLNLFTPTRKARQMGAIRDGRRKTIYDSPRTPWVSRIGTRRRPGQGNEIRGRSHARTHRDDHRLDQPGPARPRHRRHPGPARTHQPRPVEPGAPQDWTWDTWDRRSDACAPTPHKTNSKHASIVSRSPITTNERRFRAHLVMMNLERHGLRGGRH